MSIPRKIAIFGASGQIGIKATEFALEHGCQVRALLRDPEKMPEALRSKVEVVKGDVTKEEDVKATVAGQDAVVVTLGTRNDLKPTTVLSDGMKNIVAAMKQQGIQLVSVCISAFLFYEPEKVPAIFHALNADHQRMYDVLKESSLKWIAVLPPHFTDEPSSHYSVKHGSSPGRAISKQDLGAFMIESLSNPEHYGQTCGIANAPEAGDK
ncbi:flavin reductase (NADPH) [Schistocerca serialis cubense]|uniref:flavin reductase (NADPH) n=1 Tax=Schistocerca serialis cubense TaxID=2023355 RepID=UPI00214E6B68|nr:flavin reductase (NADPH) [Schistocerca serialis cubense]